MKGLRKYFLNPLPGIRDAWLLESKIVANSGARRVQNSCLSYYAGCLISLQVPDTLQNSDQLERSVSLFQATVYGVGIILGTGIYALIGEAAGIAGNAVWISFVIAAFIASCTAVSYAELWKVIYSHSAMRNC